MLQYERISNFMKKLIFCKVPVHSHQTVWEIKLLILSKEQKEQRVRLHFSFLSMLYFIWVKLLYSHLEQRDVTIWNFKKFIFWILRLFVVLYQK